MEPAETMNSKIEETLIEILKKVDMDEMTEFKVRCIASAKLGIDLSVPQRKQFVRRVVESFLLSMEEEPVAATAVAAVVTAAAPPPTSTEKTPPPPPPPSSTEEKEESKKSTEKEEEKEEEEEKEDIKPKIGEKSIDGKVYDEYGGVIVCKLSSKRRVTVQDFKGKTLVSIREYYRKNGKQFPSSKGISLSNEQWSSFRTSVPAIEEAIKKMELRLGSGSSFKGDCSKAVSDYIGHTSQNGTVG